MLLRRWDESATMNPTAMEESPDEKNLRSVSFVVHATRGLLRDQNTRRWAMFVLLLAALLLIFAGSTFLGSWLDPREHLIRALVFWFICVWLTVTALLLSFFDLLMVRAEARRAERAIREEVARIAASGASETRDQQG